MQEEHLEKEEELVNETDSADNVMPVDLPEISGSLCAFAGME